MAESVEYRKELMLSELEQLKRIKLMDASEINKIKKQREHFEYKLARSQKSLDDINAYISYERTLLLFIQERRKNRQIYQKKRNIDSRITRRISDLYNKALTRFPGDISTWDNFIKFLKATNQKSKVGSIFDKYIHFHGDKPEMWMKAMLWEWKETTNMERLISFLTRGIQRHPNCVELYTVYINAELENAIALSIADKKLDGDLETKQDLALKRSLHVYNELKKINLHSLTVLQQLEEKVKEFPFAKTLHDIILDDIQNCNE